VARTAVVQTAIIMASFISIRTGQCCIVIPLTVFVAGVGIPMGMWIRGDFHRFFPLICDSLIYWIEIQSRRQPWC